MHIEPQPAGEPGLGLAVAQLDIQKGDGPSAENTRAVQIAEHYTNQSVDTDFLSIRKPWLRVQAECLLAGWVAELVADATTTALIVQRWGRTRTFSNIAEAEAWLQGVAGGVR
jgi:hypothetical protein